MKKLLIVPVILIVIINLSFPGSPPSASWFAIRADTLKGTDKSDVLRGDEGNDFIEAGMGDDQLWGEAGDDHLKGGAGNDVLHGGSGSDVMEGGIGNDYLVGGSDRDWMFGEDGDDDLRGEEGNDVLDGGMGVDYLHGNSGDDMLDGGAGDDTASGGDGNDIIDGGDGFDVLLGGPGNDDMDGGDDDDVLRGGEGDDTLDGADGNDDLSGGLGNDSIIGRDGQDVLRGDAGDDVLSGGDGADILIGGTGYDMLSGGFGDDTLLGGANADTLLAGPGDDMLRGGADNDLLIGGPGEDVLEGGAGSDRLRGGRMTDTILAGDGDDVIFLRQGDVDELRIESIDGGLGVDTLILNGFYSAVSMPQVSVAPDDTTGKSDIQGAEFWITDPLTEGRYSVTRVEHVLHSYFFPFSGQSDSSPSTLRLTNPSMSASLTGWIEFYGEKGDSITVSVNDEAAAHIHEFEIPSLGRIDLTIRNTTPLTAHLFSEAPIGGVAVGLDSELGNFGITDNRLSDGFLIPVIVDRKQGLDTAVTILNGGVNTALKLTLRTNVLGEVEAKEIDLPTKALISGYVGDFIRTTHVLDGVLVIQGGTIGGTAFLTGPQKDDLLSIPVIPILLPVIGNELHFPLVTAGNDAETSIILVNPTFSTARGTLEFFDQEGGSLELEIKDHGLVSSVPFDMSGGRSTTFSTSNIGTRVSATARVTFEEGFASGLLTFSIPGAGMGASGSGTPLQKFITPVTHSNSNGVSTRVIVQNFEVASSVTMTLRDEDGNRVRRGEITLQLPANGFISRTVEDLFPRAKTSEFEGTLTVEASEATVASIVLQIDSIRNEILTLPVVPLN